MRNFAALAATAALFIAAPSYAATYITDTANFTGVGDEIGSAFDQVTVGGVAGTFTNPGVYALNNISFITGINSNNSNTTSGVFANTITIGSSSYTYKLPYTITIGASDTLNFLASAVTLGGYTFSVNPLALTTSGTTTGVLTADVAPAAAVPETATWAMMLAGFGMIGFAARRRQSVKTTVRFA